LVEDEAEAALAMLTLANHVIPRRRATEVGRRKA
jgi:hypothetical protein